MVELICEAIVTGLNQVQLLSSCQPGKLGMNMEVSFITTCIGGNIPSTCAVRKHAYTYMACPPQGGDFSNIMRVYENKFVKRSVQTPPGCSDQPQWFEPGQPPGSANHPWLLPEKTGLAIVNVREGIGMEESVIKSQAVCYTLSKLQDVVTQTLEQIR